MACGQYGQDQAPSAADGQLALRELQRLLDSWSNDNLTVWTTVDMSETTVAGTASYDFTGFDLDGVTPATAADQRVPVSLQNVWIDTPDYKLTQLTELEYDAIYDKTIRGRPAFYFYKRYVHVYANDPVPPDEPTPNDLRGTLYLYPTPDQAYTVHAMGRLPLGVALTLDSTLVFPPGYEHAVVRNLAVTLCDFFGIDPKPSLVQSAINAREALAVHNFVAGKLDTGLPIYPKMYRWYEGR